MHSTRFFASIPTGSVETNISSLLSTLALLNSGGVMMLSWYLCISVLFIVGVCDLLNIMLSEFVGIIVDFRDAYLLWTFVILFHVQFEMLKSCICVYYCFSVFSQSLLNLQKFYLLLIFVQWWTLRLSENRADELNLETAKLWVYLMILLVNISLEMRS